MEIVFENVDFIYQPNSPFSHQALKDISLTIKDGDYAAFIGHTGSGKSTLLQHLNGILRPTSGTVRIGDFELTTKKNNEIKSLRRKVGVVFQYPEHQLFEETVEKDILFGPKNFVMDVEEAKNNLPTILEEVVLPTDVLQRSPFELRGGQMRRVAIAGVLITEPNVLILDEPTAGLDPRGRKQIMSLIDSLHKKKRMTIILVTHHMEDVLRHANQAFVLNKGELVMQGEPVEVFQEEERLRKIGLGIPEELQLINQLKQTLGLPITYLHQSPSELGKDIAKALHAGGNR